MYGFIQRSASLHQLLYKAFVCSSESTGGAQAKQVDAAGQDNPRWPGYLASLTRNGYFKGNIPGSAQHKELMTTALHSFMQSQAQQQSAGPTAAPAQSIVAILQEPVQPELFKVIFCRPCRWILSAGCAFQHVNLPVCYNCWLRLQSCMLGCLVSFWVDASQPQVEQRHLAGLNTLQIPAHVG